MKVKLWGVRGSIPTPFTNEEYQERITAILKKAIREKISDESEIPSFLDNLPAELGHLSGGNTTCVEVKTDEGERFILDGGTGIRNLGYNMMKEITGKSDDEIRLFFTHTHWDHIQGIPFFTPMYLPGKTLHIYSPFHDMEQRLIMQMDERFFPTSFNGTASKKIFQNISEGEILHFPGSLQIDFIPVRHPGGCHAYRFRQNGKIFIFATDAEFTGEVLEKTTSYDSFFQNADVLILDSQYTLDDSFIKYDWGHTSYTMAVNCGVRWKVKKLILTHHEPSYHDKKLNDNLQEAIHHKDQLRSETPEIILAGDGMEIVI
jgi:phosphoribosyl 1,2-cyclic phosphodiesterase